MEELQPLKLTLEDGRKSSWRACFRKGISITRKSMENLLIMISC